MARFVVRVGPNSPIDRAYSDGKPSSLQPPRSPSKRAWITLIPTLLRCVRHSREIFGSFLPLFGSSCWCVPASPFLKPTLLIVPQSKSTHVSSLGNGSSPASTNLRFRKGPFDLAIEARAVPMVIPSYQPAAVQHPVSRSFVLGTLLVRSREYFNIRRSSCSFVMIACSMGRPPPPFSDPSSFCFSIIFTIFFLNFFLFLLFITFSVFLSFFFRMIII